MTAVEPRQLSAEFPPDDVDYGRVPPNDQLAEQSLLGAMLLSKDAIADVTEVLQGREDFFRVAHQTIYQAIIDLFNRDEPADPTLVGAELDRRGELKRVGGAPYLLTLTQTVTAAASASYYAEIVKEKAILRRLGEAGVRIAQFSHEGTAYAGDVATLVDRAQAEILAVTERSRRSEVADLEHVLMPTLSYLDELASQGGQGMGVPTGFYEFDDVTQGLHPGQMIIVAARPGVGKALALETVLPTPDGKTTMGEVQPGDMLLDKYGKPTEVVAATEVMYERRCYEIVFDDGTTVVADEDHQWLTFMHGAGKRTPAVRTTRAIAAGMATHRFQVPDYHRYKRRFISSVTEVDSVPVRCVQVAHPEHLYLCTEEAILTHNSTLAMDFCRSASIKHGMASVYFSLEMSKQEMGMRLLSAQAGIKLADMRSGKMSDDDWTRLARTMGEIKDAPLMIDDSPNLDMTEIRGKARRLKQRNDLRLIVVDYLQLMTSGKKVESRQQEVSEMSRSLKLLAKELEVPLVAVCQLNRGPEQRTDKRPMVSDLRESGSLEQDADMVILLHRPDAFERDDPRGGEADLILGKHRNGPTATITIAHQLHMSRFRPFARG